MRNVESAQRIIRATLSGLAVFSTILVYADSLNVTGHILPSSCASEQSTTPMSFRLNACPVQASRAQIEILLFGTQTPPPTITRI